MWWLRGLGQIVKIIIIGNVFIAAFALAYSLFILGIGWIHIDAFVERRMPWLSWPVMVAFDGWVAWALIRSGLEERRLRQELPLKIGLRALRCPLCGGPLPAWGGVLERCTEPYPFPHWGDSGRPEGCFNLRCDPCGCEICFAAWLDGSVRPHLGWLWEHKERYITIVGQPRGRAAIEAIRSAPRALVYLSFPWTAAEREARRDFFAAAERLSNEHPSLGMSFYWLDEEETPCREFMASIGLADPDVETPSGAGSLVWLESGRVLGYEVDGHSLGAAGICDRSSSFWRPQT